MNGYQAFDELVRDGLMEVNEVGWGRIVKVPREKRQLGFLVRCVTAMASFDNQIERSRCDDPHNILFRKRTCPQAGNRAATPCPNCGGGGIDTITDDVGSTIVQTCEDCRGTGRLPA